MQDFLKEWQVEAQGEIYEADFEELKQWIAEGAILPSDRVKRGELRWLAAERVPELCNFFNSVELSGDADNLKSECDDFHAQFAFENPEENKSEVVDKTVCHLHKEAQTHYACDVCKHFFCKNCPKSFGGNVRICPLCDSLCRSVTEPVSVNKSVGAVNKPYSSSGKNSGIAEISEKSSKNPGFAKLLENAMPTIFSRFSKLRRH